MLILIIILANILLKMKFFGNLKGVACMDKDNGVIYEKIACK